MLDKEKKEQLVCRAWFLKRFKSGKGNTLQCGQSHEGNPATEIAHFEKWAQMAYLRILTREQAIERERMEQLIGACLYYTSCFLTLCFSLHSPFFLFDFQVTSFLSFFLSFFFLLLFFLALSYLFLSIFSCPCPPSCAQPRPFYTAYCDGFYYFIPQLLLSRCGCPSQTTHWFVNCPAITASLCWPCHIPFPDKRVFFCFLALHSIPIRIRVGHSLLLTPIACTQ